MMLSAILALSLVQGATPPQLRAGSISNRDYPASAVRDQAEGTVVVRLGVGADGRVTGCTIASSSGNFALDATTCSLAHRRYRFRPAFDAAGQPVPGEAIRTVVWALPHPEPAETPGS